MGLRIKLISILLIITGFVPISEAAWQGSVEVLSGTWGSSNDQFGIEYQDTNDVFGGPFYILLDGGIIVADLKNGRRKIYNGGGTLTKVVKCIKSTTGEWNEECRIPSNDYIQTTADGNIWVGLIQYQKQLYSLYSPTGQLIKTVTTSPLELGVIKFARENSNGSATTVIQYHDVTYSIKSPKLHEFFRRDSAGGIYGVMIVGAPNNHYRIYKYSRCGKVLGSVDLPINNIEEITELKRPTPIVNVQEEYGEPVIAPNGDVYTWKRTPDKYSILKWTWVDDPNVLTGPDAPTGLTVTPFTSGLALAWTASPNDPGCVTGYEISRATSAGGDYTAIASVEAETVKYHDMTASAGKKYFYKVRAKAGKEYSTYSNEASGTR